ncbi:hypothetical protein ACFXOQ_36235 [Streptomyces californicus]
MQQAIGDSLAKELLSGTVTDGDTVSVSVDDAADKLVVGREVVHSS